MNKKTNEWDSSENALESQFMKFNIPLEDKVFGTLISKRQIKSAIPGKESELVWIYELHADSGSYHTTDDKKKVIPEPIVINKGDVISIGGKPGIDNQLRNVKLGQLIGFKFLEEKASKTKGFAAQKVIKVFSPKNDDGTPQMDMEWVEAQNTPDKQFGNF
jgi:hypothetical protein